MATPSSELRKFGKSSAGMDRLASLIQTDLMGVVFVERGTVLEANEAFLRLIGYSREDLRDGAISWARITPVEFQHLDDMALEELRERQTCTPYEKEFARKDGRRVPVLVGIASCGDGQFTGFALDRTETQLAEAASRRFSDDLRQFAYGASHDLQEPLRNIRTHTELLARGLGPETDVNTRDILETISSSAERLEILIHSLLSFVQVNTGFGSHCKGIELEPVLGAAVLNLESAIQDSKAAIVHDPLPSVPGNHKLLLQLFQNLLSNSIKYRGSDPPQIYISAERQGAWWLFMVADNGIGVDLEYHESIFGVFTRLHGPEVPGTGLGLALCRRVVERHGGKMWVESELGRGATFYFTLQAV